MRSRVYIETSIPSFYYEVRTEPDMVARREWTRRLWATADRQYDLFTSVAVIEELENGEFPQKAASARSHPRSSAPAFPVGN